MNTLCALGEHAKKVEGEKKKEMERRKFGVKGEGGVERKGVALWMLDENIPLRKV